MIRIKQARETVSNDRSAWFGYKPREREEYTSLFKAIELLALIQLRARLKLRLF